MFTHMCVGTDDLTRAKTFYDAIFAVFGANPGTLDAAKQRIVYRHDGASFLVGKPIDGSPATHANGGTVGFRATGPEQIDAWHAAGVAHGGTTCEDPPGLRTASNFYLAYLRDPDGNKLCAMHVMPKQES